MLRGNAGAAALVAGEGHTGQACPPFLTSSALCFPNYGVRGMHQLPHHWQAPTGFLHSLSQGARRMRYFGGGQPLQDPPEVPSLCDALTDHNV